jgi:hypothetical protein
MGLDTSNISRKIGGNSQHSFLETRKNILSFHVELFFFYIMDRCYLFFNYILNGCDGA